MVQHWSRKVLFLTCLLLTSWGSYSKTESLGHYWLGRLKESQKLPTNGDGYTFIREERQNQYGHPNLIQFIEGLSRQVKNKNLGILWVGDLSKKQGGKIPSFHRSHQNGLDVDIFFNEETGGQTHSLVNASGKFDSALWRPEYGEIMKIASQDPKVARIFINPTIKTYLCKTYPNENWLQKIQPIKGHTSHFHVRLNCPNDSPRCVAQPKVRVKC